MGLVGCGWIPDVGCSPLTFLPYNSVRALVVGTIRFWYDPRQGTDRFLLYDDRLNTDRSQDGAPRLPLSAQRTVLLESTHTFNL